MTRPRNLIFAAMPPHRDVTAADVFARGKWPRGWSIHDVRQNLRWMVGDGVERVGKLHRLTIYRRTEGFAA